MTMELGTIRPMGELSNLTFDFQASLDNNLNKLTVSDQEISVADKSERTI